MLDDEVILSALWV